MRGQVIWFDNRKGYGFLKTENRESIFVHYTEIAGGSGRKELFENETVDFDLYDTPKGLMARNVKKAE
jgi:CspA family cold shock protein